MKDYNDRCEFARGIGCSLQLAAGVVRDVSRQVAGPAAFAGHVGADNFASRDVRSRDHARGRDHRGVRRADPDAS
jgi:hypothetical protein